MILCPTPTSDPHAFSPLLQWFYACFKFLYLFPFIAPYWLLLALSYHAHSLSLRFNSSCHWIPPFISVRISPHPNLPPFPIQHMVLLSLHSLWVLSACSAPEDVLLLTEILLFHLTLLPLSSYTLQHRVSQTMKTASSRFGFCDFPHKQFRLFYICESPGVQVNSLLGSDFFHKRKSRSGQCSCCPSQNFLYSLYRFPRVLWHSGWKNLSLGKKTTQDLRGSFKILFSYVNHTESCTNKNPTYMFQPEFVFMFSAILQIQFVIETATLLFSPIYSPVFQTNVE